jgi:hypothetical protein
MIQSPWKTVGMTVSLAIRPKQFQPFTLLTKRKVMLLVAKLSQSRVGVLEKEPSKQLLTEQNVNFLLRLLINSPVELDRLLSHPNLQELLSNKSPKKVQEEDLKVKKELPQKELPQKELPKKELLKKVQQLKVPLQRVALLNQRSPLSQRSLLNQK